MQSYQKLCVQVASKSWEFTSKLPGKPRKLRFRDSRFQNFPEGACPRTPLDSSRLRNEIVPPNFNALAPPLATRNKMSTQLALLQLRFSGKFVLFATNHKYLFIPVTIVKKWLRFNPNLNIKYRLIPIIRNIHRSWFGKHKVNLW